MLHELDRGATFLNGQGAYSGKERKVVLVAIKRQQLAELKELVVGIDPPPSSSFRTATRCWATALPAIREILFKRKNTGAGPGGCKEPPGPVLWENFGIT